MPPVRKGSKTAEDIASANKMKPMKTVRTHEENQERAYVAASRRSDRSLEARIESARRASEIHKKRTGRAFRITEEDVLNEQYYEEVDDDIPASIRRLQMHLNGLYHWNNPRFDSYMISNYAKHHAAWIAQRYGQQGNSQYANPPIFSNSFGQTPQAMSGAPMASPSTATAPSPGFPPAASNQGQQPNNAHQRPASIVVTPGSGFSSSSQSFPMNNDFMTEEQRRFSLPAHPPMRKNANQARSGAERSGSGSAASEHSNNVDGQTSRSSASPHQPTSASPLAMNPMGQPMMMMSGQDMDNMSPTSFSPFSPNMPLNVSQLWDPSAHMQNMAFYGNNMGYQYNPNAGSSKAQEQSGGYNSGIHQTLTSNPLGMAGPAPGMGVHNVKVGSPSAGGGQPFDAFWSGDANGQANMGTDFEGLFNFPSVGGEDQEGINFLDDFINVNDDSHAAE